MFLELGNPYTKKLKKILSSKTCFILLGIFCALYCWEKNNNPFLVLNHNEKIMINGKITYYEWQEKNSIKIEFQTKKNKMIGYYTFKEKEKTHIEEIIKFGTNLEIQGTVQIPTKNTIPHTFSYQDYLKSQKIFYTIQIDFMKELKKGNWWAKGKEKLFKQCEKSKHQYYLKKIILGINTKDNQEITKIYQKNGISHIFAISGMHFYMIYHIVYSCIKRKIKKETKALGITLIAISIYYLMLNSSISSSRAYTMICLLTINKMTHLNLSTKILYYYNLLINIWKNPYCIWNISFYYSFILSFALLYCTSKKHQNFYQIVHTGIIIFLFSLPITIKSCYSINPWSILNNIIWIPIITTILFPILILNFFIPSMDFLSHLVIKGIEQGNIWCASFPGSEITMPEISIFVVMIYYFCLILIFYFHQNKFLILLIILLLFWKIHPKFNPNGYLYFLDVGQGDSALIISPYQKEIILIDTGPPSKVVQNNISTFLKSLGITKINVVVLSHGDTDHSGNILSLLENHKIQKILFNQGDFNRIEQEISEKYPEKIVTDYQSKHFFLYRFQLQEKKSENQNSQIVHLCLWQTCTLFMGDANQMIEEEILKKYQIQANILKVGHHGSKTSTSNNLLNEISFQIGIISAGRNNFYHHPHKEVIEKLENHKIKIFNTQTNGTIKIKINQKGFTINTCPP